MGVKRKRPASRNASCKRTKVACLTGEGNDDGARVDHPVLNHYFPRVLTLRQHLLADLQDRKQHGHVAARVASEHDTPTARLLDSVIVGYRATTDAEKAAHRERRARDVLSFTQQLPSSTIGSNTHDGSSTTQQHAAQLEIVDFVVWLLFRRSRPPAKPQHLLSQGFDRLAARGERGLQLTAVPGIPGIISRFANPHVELVTSAPWCALLGLLGKGGDVVMVDLLLECCLFLPAGGYSSDGSSGSSNHSRSLTQFSGVPLSSLQPFDFANNGDVQTSATLSLRPPNDTRNGAKSTAANPRLPSQIKFVRNRMFFAQPSTSANGRIKFGMHSVHVLNRCADLNSEEETLHVLKYIFPRQFRLHNVFTSTVDNRESALPFKDYTLRESEIKRVMLNAKGEVDPSKKAKVPKRLAGMALELVGRLRRLHRRCAYAQLLKHYCGLSDESIAFIEKGEMPEAITDLATPSSRVSAFCQAVIKRVVPNAFWGDGEAGENNKHILLKHIDTFLRARKFESFTLQTFLDSLKLTSMSWLRAPNQAEPSKAQQHMSQTDFTKRKELLAEFIYYLFDSLLIPLVRSHFHVTESNTHRNRLFYFRHDAWRALCAPALEAFRADLFEELNGRATKQRLAARSFKFSSVRLLPKVKGFRPITNLRRRPYVWVSGRKVLGKSINAALNPAFRALNFEKETHRDDLGCSLFSVGDIYPKLKEFKARLQRTGQADRQLYFAKVDVQACFDTIPQDAVLKVVNTLFTSREYVVANTARVKPPEATTLQKGAPSMKPVVKFSSHARPSDYMAPDASSTEPAAGTSVLVSPLGQQAYHQQQIEDMITEHVEFNLIKLGKKYYRQKKGIPQGSVLSSLLCNFFYGKLERQELHFLREQKGDTSQLLLLRLVDDFLLITTERHLAERFLDVMHEGLPEYGVTVKPAKSLVNFAYSCHGIALPLAEDTAFPYCGLMIHTQNLDISKSGQLKPGTTVSDSLTVEYSNVPGRTFRRKALNALKIQMHGMYFDTSLNTLDTALANLYRLFHNSAQRAEHYMRNMPKRHALSFETVKNTIQDLVQLAWTMIRRRRVHEDSSSTSTSTTGPSYACAIRREQAVCIAYAAFKDAFLPRQTKHSALLDWLGRTIKAHRPRTGAERAALLRVAPSAILQ